MKRILVPIDYSEHSKTVIEFAAGLAVVLGAEIWLLHVWETMPHCPPELLVTTPTGPRRLEDLVEENAAREMKAFRDGCRLPERVRTTTLVDSGPAAKRILETIERSGAMLVVLGTHGRGGPRRWALGSVAERVVRLSPVPVITVREPAGRAKP